MGGRFAHPGPEPSCVLPRPSDSSTFLAVSSSFTSPGEAGLQASKGDQGEGVTVLLVEESVYHLLSITHEA